MSAVLMLPPLWSEASASFDEIFAATSGHARAWIDAVGGVHHVSGPAESCTESPPPPKVREWLETMFAMDEVACA